MKTFTDLDFKESSSGSLKAQIELGRGIIISVLAGESLYSQPRENGLKVEEYSTFECALLKRDIVEGYLNFATRDWVYDAQDDVLSYVTREEITSLMEKVQATC